ncbi:MAG TPA: GH92 family glycosyl hydrolase [Candidatus Baltobacteraceae bacterium]|nr:GH92 family glycosyl hydrolase [Candidatus Baltobacteraceae bacterium]
MKNRALVVLLAVLAAWLLPTIPAHAQGRTALVDPFLGTSTTPDGSDVIDDFPGADVPFGMVQWSPDTPSQNAGGGYEYNDKAIQGFSLTHLSGPGCGVFGDFRVLPVSGEVSQPWKAQQPFAHADETASPGYYAVTLGNPGIRAEIGVTPRTGIARFTFPAGAKANLLFNIASDQAGVRNAGFSVTGPNEVEGFADTGGFCGMPDRYSVYFVAQFDAPVSSTGTWHGTTQNALRSVTGADSGGWVSFDTSKSAIVHMRVAISFVDTNGARANLAADKAGWDLNRVRSDAAAAWERVLDRIDVAGGTNDEQRQFYTAFYHAMLHPNLFDDADGRYRGYDGMVHRVRTGHHEYANFSDWDIYRTLVPLQALVAPDEVSDMMQSLVDAAKQDVFLPRWALVNGATSVMGGDSVDPVIAGAYAFGARGFDVRGAIAAMVKGASDLHAAPADGWYVERPELAEYLQNGYIVNTHVTSVSPVPNGASETLEYALDDFSIAQLAKAGGDEAVYRTFMKRSSNWANLFDTATGWVAPRDRDGAFEQTPITSAGQSGFQEGNAAQYTWMVPQDLGGLIRGMGGAAATRQKLDTFFSQINAGQDKPYAWLGNEPTLGSPWVYLSAGAPYRAQQIVRTAMTTMFADTPHGIPGNDDLGTMSAWYMWSAMGLYPQNPSVRILDIGSPIFTSVTLHSPHGLEIAITAPQAADAAPYVQSLRVNGKATQKTWLALPARGRVTLDFALAATPNAQWGAAPQDAPPSFALQPVHFPASSPVLLTSTASQLAAAGDGTTSASFVIDNSAGTSAETIAWKAQLPAGFSAQPAAGTVTVAAAAQQTVALTLQSANAAPGLWNVPIVARSARGARIPALTFALRIERAADPPSLGFIENRFDDTITPFDPVTLGFGAPVAAGKEPRDAVFSPDRKTLYVADRGGQSLAIVDAATMKASFVKVGQSPDGTAISADGKTVWIANYDDNSVQAIDTATRVAGKPIAVGLNPRYCALTPDGRMLLVTNVNGNTVTPIVLQTRQPGADIPVGAHPSGIAVTPDGTLALVANSGSGTVTPIDLTGALPRPLAPVSAGLGASMIAISPDGRTALVSNFSAATVSEIDIATRTSRTIKVGLAPYGIAFSKDGKTAWVVARGDGALVPIHVATGKAGKQIPVGSTSPYTLQIP